MTAYRFAERLKTLPLLISLIISIFFALDSYAQDSKPSRTQNQMETTIIHADKYGVYGPNVIFYWDSAMSKQKLDALMKTADRLRNKHVVVTYSATGDLKKDKRPLIVDLAAQMGESDQTLREATSREEPQRPAVSEEKPKPSDEKPKLTEEKPTFAEGKPRPSAQKEEPLDVGKESSWGEPSLKDYSKRRLYNEEKPSIPSPRDDPSQKDMQASFKEQQAPRPLFKDAAPGLKPVESSPITREEIIAFITQVLKLNERKDLNTVMAYYADQVNYYDRGVVNKDYIKKDLGYYFKNWDRISTSLEGDVVLIVTDQHDMRIAKYICSYYVENVKKAIRGRAENVWKIQKINNELKIVDVKQKMISNQ